MYVVHLSCRGVCVLSGSSAVCAEKERCLCLQGFRARTPQNRYLVYILGLNVDRERVFHTRSVRRSALKRSERSDLNRQTDSRLPGRCTSSRYMYPLDIHLQKSPRSQPRHNPASGFGMFASAPALELSSPGCECAIHISYDRSRTRLWTVLSISSPMLA